MALFNIDALFDVPEARGGREIDSFVVKKAKTKPKTTQATVRGGGNNLMVTISSIVSTVDRYLGQFRETSLLIRDETTLIEYIDKCIENGFISIDTETTGLDPLQDTLVGICIYTPGKNTAYIPVNHKSYITQMRVENQLGYDILKREFQRLIDSDVKTIMFNSAFDIRFLHQIGVYFTCYWDCYLGARLLNENEGSGNNGLKKLHNKYVLNGVGDAFKFDDLFKGVSFDLIPITTGYLYAAHDAIITYELYEYQKRFLDPNSNECVERGLQDVAWVFHNIEMPIVDVVVSMEDNGITLDLDYANELSVKYNKLLDERMEECISAINHYERDIAKYRTSNPNVKLDDPININSPSQLSVLLYDIMGLDAGVDKKTKKPIRGTGDDILQKLDNPVCEAIRKYRGVAILIKTFIDKLPNCVNPKDGRVHCKFNQYGADTGRFSSNDPNLQNIPSHNKDIRKMFKAQDGYVLMSSDFSQQEPKCLAALCKKQGDAQMYDTFMQGKDLYSEIASKAFHMPYEECKEFRPDGTTNKDGKARRSQAKSILLGVLYGRGTASVAEQLGCTTQEAEDIKESVFLGFPAIKRFEQESLEHAHDYGFVTTVCGRKRRLPDLQLPEYEFRWINGVPPIDDPLDFDNVDTSVPNNLVQLYSMKLRNARFNQKRAIFEEANTNHGIWIVDNGGVIAEATRQCVNSRIQGSAADLTKLAMIELHRNERLKELGFRILIPVHDEIIAECPKENAKECSGLLASTMSKAAEKILEMPIKCDVAVSVEWYGGELDVSTL